MPIGNKAREPASDEKAESVGALDTCRTCGNPLVWDVEKETGYCRYCSDEIDA